MGGSDKDQLLDRFLGSAMGTFVGDALGEPVEGWSHRAIYSRFGLLDSMVRGEGSYTDDTQMMIGILETLIEKGGFDPVTCAGKFQENFDPTRGYGRRIFGVVERIRQGIPWDQVGTDSFGNGGAMRIAPIGCFYYSELQALKENAIMSARITHNHPEGLAGAVAQATAVGLALQYGVGNEPIEPERFLDRITTQVTDIDKGFAESLDGIRLIHRGSVIEMIEAMKDVQWQRRGFLEKRTEKDIEEVERQAEIDIKKRQIETLRKAGFSEEEIEDKLKEIALAVVKEQEVRLKQIKMKWNKQKQEEK